MRLATSQFLPSICRRNFSLSARRSVVKNIADLPDRITPIYKKTPGNDLLSLRWPSPARNILLLKKDSSPPATEALLEFAQHITSSHPDISIIAEAAIVKLLDEKIPNTICSAITNDSASDLFHELPHVHAKTDLIATFGGDGTILRASSLFSTSGAAPPVLSFAMGTLGFLGEWKFKDYKHAFRELYMSGAVHERSSVPAFQDKLVITAANGWKTLRGQAMGETRAAKVLFRQRLKVGMTTPNGKTSPWSIGKEHYAMNEVLLHRGANPHLIHILIHINGRFLTEAVADGMLVSTPTGSTAYSLSSGGSIIHPMVPALLLSPICPRSLSFRPLVLPASSEITLTLSEKNRSAEAEFSIDGLRSPEGVAIGSQIKVTGEKDHLVSTSSSSEATCGIPFVMRGDIYGGDDGWLGGLTNLLKFNYPFGRED